LSRLREYLRDRNALQKRREVGQCAVVVGRVSVEFAYLRQQSWAVLARQRLHDARHMTAIDSPEHRARIRFGQRTAAKGDQLIQQT
jgi:hypothetical protein